MGSNNTTELRERERETMLPRMLYLVFGEPGIRYVRSRNKGPLIFDVTMDMDEEEAEIQHAETLHLPTAVPARQDFILSPFAEGTNRKGYKLAFSISAEDDDDDDDDGNDDGSVFRYASDPSSGGTGDSDHHRAAGTRHRTRLGNGKPNLRYPKSVKVYAGVRIKYKPGKGIILEQDAESQPDPLVLDQARFGSSAVAVNATDDENESSVVNTATVSNSTRLETVGAIQLHRLCSTSYYPPQEGTELGSNAPPGSKRLQTAPLCIVSRVPCDGMPESSSDEDDDDDDYDDDEDASDYSDGSSSSPPPSPPPSGSGDPSSTTTTAVAVRGAGTYGSFGSAQYPLDTTTTTTITGTATAPDPRHAQRQRRGADNNRAVAATASPPPDSSTDSATALTTTPPPANDDDGSNQKKKQSASKAKTAATSSSAVKKNAKGNQKGKGKGRSAFQGKGRGKGAFDVLLYTFLDFPQDAYTLAEAAALPNASRRGSNVTPQRHNHNSNLNASRLSASGSGESMDGHQAPAPGPAQLYFKGFVTKQLMLVGTEVYELEDVFDLGAGGGGSGGMGHGDNDAMYDEDDDSDEDGGLCVICLTNGKDTTILPCRHMCLCYDCAAHLRLSTNKCPICRSDIERVMTI